MNVYNGKGWYELPYDMEKTLPWHLNPDVGQNKFLIDLDLDKNENLLSKFGIDETWQIHNDQIENIMGSIQNLDISISDFVLAKLTLTDGNFQYLEDMIDSQIYKYFSVIFINNQSKNIDRLNEIRDMLLNQKIYIIDSNTIS